MTITALLNSDAKTKFTVIASACRSDNATYINQIKTSEMMGLLASLLPSSVRDTISPVTGYYHEEGIEQTHWTTGFEQSVMFGVDDKTTLGFAIRLFCSTYKQDCVLVQDNDTGEISLMGLDWADVIGTKWRKYTVSVTELETFCAGHKAFTIMPSREIFEVVA